MIPLAAATGAAGSVKNPGAAGCRRHRPAGGNDQNFNFGRGIHRGEDLYENQGFIVHFFDRAKVERLARGYETVSVEELEEGTLPRRLYRVTVRRPIAPAESACEPS